MTTMRRFGRLLGVALLCVLPALFVLWLRSVVDLSPEDWHAAKHRARDLGLTIRRR